MYTNSKVLDTLKSNRFEYDENINALYVNYNKQLKQGIMFQLGVRAENTNIKGNSKDMLRWVIHLFLLILHSKEIIQICFRVQQ